MHNEEYENLGHGKRGRNELPRIQAEIDIITKRLFKQKCLEEGITMQRAIEKIIFLWIEDKIIL